MTDAQGTAPSRAEAAETVAAAIRAYAPSSLSAEAAGFARAAVAQAAPGTPARARALLYAVSRLARFGESVGLEPAAETLLRPAVIERFILTGARTLAPATRRTLATNLRALLRTTQADPQPTPLPRERAKPPYSEAEIAAYLRLAATQSTAARRMRATALVALGAGAGIVASELRGLRGSDVIRRSGGLLVEVSGRRARVVPVLARFHEPLGAAAGFAGEGWLIGGGAADRRNLTDALGRALSSDAALPRLEGGRLRATWLCECARAVGLKALMDAAGIRCSQRLGDLVADLPEAPEPEAIALLGGSDEGGA